jgi:hypothetical protein
MNTVNTLLRDVTLGREYQDLAELTDHDHDLGFMVTEHPLIHKAGELTLLGFGVSGWQQDTHEVADSFEAVTTLEDLAPEVLTIARQGKGIGARLYNSVQELAATAEQPTVVGLYAAALDAEQPILDKRRDKDHSMFGQLLRVRYHGWLKLVELYTSPEMAIRVATDEQAHRQAILYNQTVAGERRKRRTHAEPSPIPGELLIYRRPGIALTKVGEYKVVPPKNVRSSGL